MITRFYVDNYKCLQNFEYKPQQFELIVGANGTGKSTVFEALDKVRRLITGEADVQELFSNTCATRWGNRRQQIFEVNHKINNAHVQYRLEVNLFPTIRIEKEIYKINDNIVCETAWEPQESAAFSHKASAISKGDKLDTLAHFAGIGDHANEVRVIKIPSSEQKGFLSDPNKSAFGYFSTALAQIMAPTYFLKINPSLMTPQVKKADPRPSGNLSNFSSYYLYMLQQKQGKMFEMMQHLRDSIKDFDSFAVEEDFEEGRRNLQVVCKQPNGKRGTSNLIKYGFEEMSDGQRALIALYTLLFCTLEPDSTLIIDEPENYVALRELQPWLMLLQDRLEEYGGQVILISHHPEFINAIAPGNTTVFEREDNGPVRIKPFSEKMVATLSPAEIMARGWENE